MKFLKLLFFSNNYFALLLAFRNSTNIKFHANYYHKDDYSSFNLLTQQVLLKFRECEYFIGKSSYSKKCTYVLRLVPIHKPEISFHFDVTI